MGIAYRYLDHEDLVITVGDAVVTRDELVAFAERQVADPMWPFGARRLADLTTVESDLSPDDVEAAAAVYAASNPTMRGVQHALIASRRWDLARVFESHLDDLGSTAIVFNTLDTACTWLGVDVDSTRSVVNELREHRD